MHGRVALGIALIGWTPLVAAWTAAGGAKPVEAAAPEAVATEQETTQDDVDACVDCHAGLTPGIVQDWSTSLHAQKDVGCADCHGDEHTSELDVERVLTVTAATCKNCHEDRYQEFARGKHAFAWAAMKAMPTTHYKPMALIDGMKGCGACHKIGLKSTEEIRRLKSEGSGYGYASCDACHTRHTFSIEEAREPEACATCHMGFDHPQWEMWQTSKHGVRHVLKRQRVLPREAQAPTCQTCHMPEGSHEVHTAWGFLGVRTDGLAPYPGEAPEWWADRVTILQGLGVLDPEGQPTARLDVVAGAQVARLSAEEFDARRAEMVAVCKQCHSESFATQQLGSGDDMVREIDHLMAEAIRVVAALYQDGVLAKPDTYAYAFPDLLTFHDSPTPIENRLFTMHLKHRMRAFQGVFHSNPDYALWYGWNEMVQDLTEIRTLAQELRAARAK
ncbi:MAG: cytochrome c3 family protein [Planctomycetes bacterium]|nr:cytochrome c3 family protein [Planctomycetota bacterium]